MPASPPTSAVRGGRIASIGRIDEQRTRTSSTPTGWSSTPGFIDVHTHYDAQLDWDPTASPSSWHGVTTVLAGNCGFTLAPAKPDDCDWLAQMLSRVEGMSAEALARRAALGAAASFGDLLAPLRRPHRRQRRRLRRALRGAALRHGRRRVAATATADEIAAMQELVRQAMREGALGFSTSQLDIHVAHDGREVPSNFAAPEEIVALVRGARRVRPRRGRVHPAQLRRGLRRRRPPADPRAWRASPGRPIELNTLTPMPRAARWVGAQPRVRPRSVRATACACTRCSRPTSSARTSRSTRPSSSTRCRASATR